MENYIRDWYVTEFPFDDLGHEINPNVTWWDFFDALDAHEDVYDVLGVSDSVIRERCFQRLAELMEVDYDYIYDQWIGG